MIYLDAATTVPTSEGVRQRMDLVMSSAWGNVSGAHQTSLKAKNLLEQAREMIADLCGSDPEQIIFTSGATEAINMVIQGYFRKNKNAKFYYSAIEHPAVINTAEWISSIGIKTIEIPVDEDGIVSISSLEEIQKDDLVCVMPVNNEIGVINDVENISEIVRSKDARLMLDCVQSFYSFDIRKLCSISDYAIFSGHKIGGPQGVGMLFIKDRKSISPLSFGGPQEWELRPGTTPVYLCDAFSYVLSSTYSRKGELIEHLKKCQLHCEEQINKHLPFAKIHAQNAQRSPHVVAVDIKGIEAQMLVSMIDSQGICVSRGSACASGAQKPSHVLMALGLDEKECESTIRLSFYAQTTLEEITQAIELISQSVNKILSVGSL